MSFREYLGIGNDDPQRQTCDWCGKEGISVWWSGSKGKYCSFRCHAAGSYRAIIIITVCVIALESILVSMQIMMFLKYPVITSAYAILIAPQVIIILIVVSFVYSVYVGRSMRKERESSELLEKSNERAGGPDAI